MRNTKLMAAAGLLLAVALAGCTATAPGTSSKTESLKGQEITYWATNQGSSIEADTKILTPELAKFTKQTGVKVNLQVIPWSDLLTKLLTATTGGPGPDVANIGNSWSPSLAATGAFIPWDSSRLDKVGGKSRFIQSALSGAGISGEDPMSLPLYVGSWVLYYNKKMFADAGITAPPTTWPEFVADAKKLTVDTDGNGTPDQWGFGLPGASNPVSAQMTFVLGTQLGAPFFTKDKPTMDNPALVKAIQQELSWYGKDRIVNPSNAEETTQAPILTQLVKGQVAMTVQQASGAQVSQAGAAPGEVGVAPVPGQSGTPANGKDIGSFVTGTNIAIFKSTEHLAASEALVKFLLSPEEQVLLNKTYGFIPPVTDAASDPAFDEDAFKVEKKTLQTRAVPYMPRVEQTKYATLMGQTISKFFAMAAQGKQPSSSTISDALKGIDQQIAAAQ